MSTASRYVVIGDVHGCLRELESLLEKVGYAPATDQLVFVGDLVDRGPFSAQVVRFVRRMSAEQIVRARWCSTRRANTPS